jgi:hypothetical protein
MWKNTNKTNSMSFHPQANYTDWKNDRRGRRS